MAWAVTLGGIRYQGRPISAEAVRRFQREIAAAGDMVAAQTAAIQRVLRMAFPLTWGVFWRGDPVRKILALPDEERGALLLDFFDSLRSKPSRPGSPTTGIGSRPPIATR
jgi:hypothetical protein